MPNTREILTELVRWTRNRECGDNYIDERHQTAITNAAKQIKQRQRERVEKLTQALLKIYALSSIDQHLQCKEGYCKRSLKRAGSIVKAALKELERNS